MNNHNGAGISQPILFPQKVYPVSDLPVYLKNGLRDVAFLKMFGDEFFANCQMYAHYLSLVDIIEDRYVKAGQRHAVRFIGKVEGHFMEQRQVRFYAKSLYIADEYLREVCRTVTGQRPLYWVHLRKVMGALFLLQGTGMLVQQIASDCGVDDHSYFCSMFRKFTGMTPNTFREGFVD